ncbi:hypothetical protein NSE01_20050 [Novosphingobium sediminis]|uniref:Uncharacterized protein n=1 Tax=Novosphingobium sediminis TaxID=707214 RepID=A0A512AKG5_9SPHN|nr:hypothetical protein NSE01_20050 [Novosphingobium sediminis]
MAKAELIAKLGDVARFFRTRWPEPVVYRRHKKGSRQRRTSQQQQRKTVWSTRNRETDWGVVRPDC